MDAPSSSSRLADRLVALRDGCLGLEREHAPLLRSLADACESGTPGPAPGAMASSRNLLHYLAIRGEDLREGTKKIAAKTTAKHAKKMSLKKKVRQKALCS